MSYTANLINDEENSNHCKNILEILGELFSTDGPYEVSRSITTISVDRPFPSSFLASTTNSALKYNDVCEDSETIKKRFGWETYGECSIPFIVRVINGEHIHYVSKRIIDTWIIRYYLNSLDPIFFLCTWMNSYPISISEANLLNEINIDHADQMYGKEPFEANKDHVFNADDIHEFYTFINVCYKKLMYNTPLCNNEKCGFIRMNTGSIVPYCTIDDQKYVPLLFFDEALKILIDNYFKIENWNLAYIKFCCIVQNIRNDIITSKSCLVTRISAIMNFLPVNTNFEEYWPRTENNTLLHTNWKKRFSPPTSASSMSLNTPLTSIYEECPTNQIVNSYSTQHRVLTSHDYPYAFRNMNSATQRYMNNSLQLLPAINYPSAFRNVNSAAQYYSNNLDSTIYQHSNDLMEHVENIPLENGTLTLDKCYPNSEYNIESISQPIIAMSNCMANDSVISHVNQMGYIQQQESYHHRQQQPDNNYYQEQNYLQQQQFVQKLYFSGESMVYRSNTPVTKTLVDPPTSETIDLTLPRPPLSQSTINTNAGNFVLERIPELHCYVPNSTVYKISFANLYGTIVHCINSIPYVNGYLLLTIDQLVDTAPLPYSTKTCANILYNNMKITLFKANSDQIAILSKYRRLSSLLPEDTPMAMLTDVNSVYQKLKCFTNISNEEREQYYLSKRRRML